MPRKRNPQDGVETLLTFRPKLHPSECLRASLDSLAEATELPHLVNVVVQGGWRRKQCKGLLELPLASEFPFDLKYTMNEKDLGDGPVMARSLRECKRRYWAYLTDEVILPPGGWDALFRCMRNEERRKLHKVIGATTSCVDDLEPPRCMDIVDCNIVLTRGSMATREERFAVWHVVDYVPLGPLVLLRSAAEKASCCFDDQYQRGGHLLDFCMQVREHSMVFLHIDQPATQLNLGCIDMDNVYAPLPGWAQARFASKWDGAGKKLSYLE
jgi:hypothetical protein